MLLQVIFHANMAAEVGAFDFEDVAETLRQKLVRRHPHVFGSVAVADADEVVANWHAIKAEENERDVRSWMACLLALLDSCVR